MKTKFAKLSKFFRVALEGATTDGRKISREWIMQMANNYNTAKYGARVWLEHIRGTLPDSPFKAYGDVVALKAEEIEIDGVKKMALLAQLSPTDDLVKMNKSRQKIYTSIEVNPNFADSGEAYIVGLAVTDSPASLATEALAFAAQHPESNIFTARKQSPENLFTESIETAIEFDEATPEIKTLSEKVKGLFAKFTVKGETDEAKFKDIEEALTLLLGHIEVREGEFNDQKGRITDLENELKATTESLETLTKKLEGEESHHQSRPTATGGNGYVETDC